MNKVEAFCEVKEGKLHVIHSDRFKQAIKTLSDGRYRLTLEKNYRKRSNSQNAYLHGVVYPIVLQGLKDLGFSNVDPHELLKFKFLKKEIVSEHGEVIETIGSTANLSTTEFMNYLAEIKQWGSEYLGVYIPDPPCTLR